MARTETEDQPTAVLNGDDAAAKRAQKQARREEKRAAKQAGRQKLTVDSQLDGEQIAKLLENLAAGTRSGHLTATNGERELTLDVSAAARVRLKARSSPKKARLLLQICWPHAKKESPPTEDAASS